MMPTEISALRWAPWCILASLLPFLPGIHGPFLLDDLANLENIPKTSDSLLSWYYTVFGNASGLLRRPLANFSFLLNYRLLGADALSFKVVNLLLHGLTGWLVFVFLRRLLGLLRPNQSRQTNDSLALGSAVVWTVHPLQVSTALYVVQRMTQLSAIGTLTALIVAMGFLAKPINSRLNGLKATLAVTAIAAVGLLSKETAALTPLLLFVIVTCLPGTQRDRFQQDTGKRLFLQLTTTLPLLLLMVILVISLPAINASYAPRSFSLIERLLSQPFVLAHYIGTIAIPDIRSMGLYLDGLPIHSPESITSWLGIAALTGTLMLAIVYRYRAPLLAYSILWFLACHALESSLIPLEMAFEHRNYLALIGPALLLCRATMRLGDIIAAPLHRLVIGASLSVLVLSTAARSHEWGEPSRFIRSEAAHHPESPRALNSLASLEFEQGNIAEAARITRQLSERHPDSFWANALHLNLLACTKTPGQPEYQALLDITRKNPFRGDITAALISILTNVARYHCDGLDSHELDRFMADLIAEMKSSADIERVYILRAMLATHNNRAGDHLQHLKAAAAANPSGVESRLLLGYYYLNTGQLDAAAMQVTQLNNLIGIAPDRNRVRELEAFIAMEQRSINRQARPNIP